MEQNIETKIAEAAKEIFLKKGYKETNMADIASAVGLTRPALHYYYRTKERLFQAVFGEILKEFLPKIKDTVSSGLTLKDKLVIIVETYMDVLTRTPELPLFIMKEASRDIENLVVIASDNNILLLAGAVFESIKKEMAAGRIREVPMIEIVYTFYGLMTFPFLSMPVAKQICPAEEIERELSGRWKDNIVNHMLLFLSPANE